MLQLNSAVMVEHKRRSRLLNYSHSKPCRCLTSSLLWFPLGYMISWAWTLLSITSHSMGAWEDLLWGVKFVWQHLKLTYSESSYDLNDFIFSFFNIRCMSLVCTHNRYNTFLSVQICKTQAELLKIYRNLSLSLKRSSFFCAYNSLKTIYECEVFLLSSVFISP